MSKRCRRAAALALALVCAPPATPGAAFLELRPGTVERPLYLAAGDFDRDGCQDLAIANYEAGSVSILVNRKDPVTKNCTGSFLPLASSPVPVGLATNDTATSGPFFIVVTDLNPEDVDGDGVANTEDDCPNVFDPIDATSGKQLDGNGNGVGDACEKVALVCGQDTARTCTSDADCASGDTCVPLDSDGDGIPDFAVSMTDKPDNCPLTYNPGQEDLETCVTHPEIAALKGPDGVCGTSDDRTGDGVGDACPTSPDLIILNASVGAGSPFGVVRVRLNDGSGGMVSRTSKTTGFAPAEVLVADFDGDRRPDLAVSSSRSNVVQFFPGQANGAFGTPKILATGKGPQGLSAADFNGDGRLDLAVANREERTVGIYLNSATGLPLKASATLQTAAQPTFLVSGRLDTDTFPDLIVLDQGGATCMGGPQPGKSCDADSDCIDPMNPANNGTCPPVSPATGTVEEFRGSAGGLLSAPAVTWMLPPDSRPRGAVLSDLDGGGTLDLAIADFSGAQVLIYSGAGDGTFALTTTLTGVDAPAALAVIDFNPQDPPGPSPDLAVIDLARNRVDLFRNDGGLSFSVAPTSPASPWNDTSAMALFGADASVGADIVLLQRAARRIEVLSGIGNGFFRALPTVTLKEPKSADGLVVADYRDDNRPDLAVVDEAGSKVTVVTNEPSGILTERESVVLPDPPSSGAAGSLITSLDDYDRDGVPNILDNCPTTYNPPFCRVTDPGCSVTPLCTDPMFAPTTCSAVDPSTLDPVTNQCDSDQNGVGDQCQQLDSVCLALDADGDTRFDYDPTALGMTGGHLDFDRDGVPNNLDNCPTVANADQQDVNMNHIGDACEIPGHCSNDSTKTCFLNTDCVSPGTCILPDMDMDGKPDYDASKINPSLSQADQIAAALDNCPLPNPIAVCSNDRKSRCTTDADCTAPAFCTQPDNDNDGVGNACIVGLALDNCPFRINITQTDSNGDGVGDTCEFPVQDLATVSPAAGTVRLLTGDGSGRLREALLVPGTLDPMSPKQGLESPSSVLIGNFSLRCLAGVICTIKTEQDLVVAEQVVKGNPSDDRLTVYEGDGLGHFTIPANVGPAAVQGDPSVLLQAQTQPVCEVPPYSGQPDPGLRFAEGSRDTIVAVVEPATSSLEILLASNQDQIFPGSSPLAHPPAHPAPLPIPGTLVDARFADMNADGVMDLVALSTGNHGSPTPNVTVYIGIGNGLFFTDPTLNPHGPVPRFDVPDGGTLLGTTNSHLQTEELLPDVIIFNQVDAAPWVLTNTLNERADIDESGRVDGFDLAILANAFGARRGEDFTILPDGTLQQSGAGYSRVVVGTGSRVSGQELPGSDGFCNGKFDPADPAYGLPVDINLDGIVDGKDLAILASRFGTQVGL